MIAKPDWVDPVPRRTSELSDPIGAIESGRARDRLRERAIAGRKLIPLIFGVVAFGFVGSTVYVNHRLAQIDQDALDVADNALPSMARLGNARTNLFQVRFSLASYYRAVSTKQSFDLHALEEQRARVNREIAAYRELPQFQGEDAVWRKLAPLLERLDAAIEPYLDRMAEGDLERAQLLFAEDIQPVFEKTNAAANALRDFNAARASERTVRIRERLHDLNRLAYLLDALCVLGTVGAALLLNRGVRSYKELIDSNAELIRKGAEEQLRQADRLKTLGYLAAGIAHELGTPLNVVALRASLIADNDIGSDGGGSGSNGGGGSGTNGGGSGGGDKTPVENARIIREQADRMAQIIRQLLNFARPNPPRKEHHDLRHIATHTSTLLQPIAARASASLSIVPGPPVPVAVDYWQLQQVVTNLVVNAIQSMPKGGRVEIAVGRRRALPPGDHGGREGDYNFLEVRDQGQGIPDDVRAHLFSPFVTTKEVGEGTGLGLAISYRLVREHGGWFDVQSQVGHGSRFTVYLP